MELFVIMDPQKNQIFLGIIRDIIKKGHIDSITHAVVQFFKIINNILVFILDYAKSFNNKKIN